MNLRKSTRDFPSSRDNKILLLIAQGKTAKEIGEMGGISSHTAEAVTLQWINFLDAKNSSNLIYRGMKLGYIS